jgi:hypothetical protein
MNWKRIRKEFNIILDMENERAEIGWVWVIYWAIICYPGVRDFILMLDGWMVSLLSITSIIATIYYVYWIKPRNK